MNLLWNCFVLLHAVLLREAVPLPQALITCENGIYYSDPNNCNNFFICSNGQKLLLTCPLSLAWDNNIKTCLKSLTCQTSLSQATAQPLTDTVVSTQILNNLVLESQKTEFPQASVQRVNELPSTSAAELPSVTETLTKKSDLPMLITDSPQTTIMLKEKFVSNSQIDASPIKETETIPVTSEAPKLDTQIRNEVTSTSAIQSLLSSTQLDGLISTSDIQSPLASSQIDEMVSTLAMAQLLDTQPPLASSQRDELISTSALHLTKLTDLVLNENEPRALKSSTPATEFPTMKDADVIKTEVVTLTSESPHDITQIIDELSSIIVDTTAQN